MHGHQIHTLSISTTFVIYATAPKPLLTNMLYPPHRSCVELLYGLHSIMWGELLASMNLFHSFGDIFVEPGDVSTI